MFHISRTNSTFKIIFYNNTFPLLFTCWWICLSIDCLILSLITYKLFMWEFVPHPSPRVCSVKLSQQWRVQNERLAHPSTFFWPIADEILVCIALPAHIQELADLVGCVFIDEPGGRRGFAGEHRKLWETGLRRDTWKVGWTLRGSGSWGHWDLLHSQWYRDQYTWTEVLRFNLKGRSWENSKTCWLTLQMENTLHKETVSKAEGSFTREMKCAALEKQLTMLSRTVILSDGGIHQMVWKTTLEGCSHWSTGDLTGGGMLMQVVLAGPCWSFSLPPGCTNHAGRWCAASLMFWK